jgi:hypothetical protein
VLSLSSSVVIALGLALAQAGPALAQEPLPLPLPDARVIEWDCPLTGQEAQTPPADPGPGALIADGNLVWYVTRIGQPRLVRFTPGNPIATAAGTCNWWDLELGTVTTGGLRLRPVGTQVFVRTLDDLQRIETGINRRTRWIDGLFSFSDLAIRSNGVTSVFTTGFAPLEVGTLNERANDVVQRLVPSSNGSATATRWEVGGGAGSIYLSGIDVHPTQGHLVYFSQPGDNQIGELNTDTGAVRRWNLTMASPDVLQPRQLDVAPGGMVWAVTGSGHIVGLNPTENTVLVATMPGLLLNNPFGVHADGSIAYTAAGEIPTFNKVGVLFPHGTPNVVFPSFDTAFSEQIPLTATPTPVPQFTGSATPVVKTAFAQEADSTGGTFFEAMIDTGMPQDPGLTCGAPPDPDPFDEFSPDDPCMASTNPLGVAHDPNPANLPQGALAAAYAAVGNSVLRIAHVTVFPQPTFAGSVSGGGWIPTTNALTGAETGKISFGLVAMKKSASEPAKGHVTYQNHTTGGRVISLELTDLQFVGNKAIIGGVCKQNTSDCLEFRVDVTDNGQPSQTPYDELKMFRDPLLGLFLSPAEGGFLKGGNLKVRQQNQ